MITLDRLQRALGGDVAGAQLLAPGPGHSAQDRSLAIRPAGDNVDGFVVHSHAGDDWRMCRDYVAERLGTGSRRAVDRLSARVAAKPAPAVVDKRQSALAIWDEAVDPRGTVVETYLSSRGIALDDVIAGAVIRYHPSCPFRPGERMQCMVAAYRSIATGEIQAIHRTALTPDGVKVDRLALGPKSGTAIMFDALDAERGSLGIGEGIETTLSGRQMGYAPAWSLGDANGIAKLPLIDGVESLSIFAEHDESGTNQRASQECGGRYRDAGREVFLIHPTHGKDLNDAWQARDEISGEPIRIQVFGENEPVSSDIGKNPPASEAAEPKPISATPFLWINPEKLPPREWLYGDHYIRQFVSATISPGAVGKSSLAIVEALAMASGKPLLGVQPAARCRVWVWNGEDPLLELQRRVMAAAIHYKLSPSDFEGWLYVDSGRTTELIIAEEQRNGFRLAIPVVEGLKAEILARRVDVMVVDPFVSSHRVSENDNNAIDRIAKVWGQIADECNCAVELVHHARKTNGAEVTTEDSRGASSLVAAARSARALNSMTEDEAARAGVVQYRRRHFRFDNGKANMAPPPEGSTWLFLASVSLGNSRFDDDGNSRPADSIAVVEPWSWPAPLDGISLADLRKAQQAVSGGRWRENIQSKDWVGIPIAEALGLDPTSKVHREKVRGMLRIWIENGMFVVVEGQDEKRNVRSFVEVGEAA